MRHRQVTLLPLIGILYFTVSGGPFGLEEVVATAGPGLALLLLTLAPLLWSLPTALITAEMSAMMPVDGGYYRWVYWGLGRYWGFLEGWWTWLFTFVDMAIYPVLVATYTNFFVHAVFGRDLTNLERWCVALLVIWFSVAVNLRGAKVVGHSSLVSFIVVMTPFALLTFCALPAAKLPLWQPFINPGSERLSDTVGVALSALMWNYMGWDNVSTFAGEVKNPGRTFPLALLLSVGLVTLTYVMPLGATLAATESWSQWNTATFTIAEVGGQLAGPWLGALITFGIVWSLCTMFNSQLLYVSRLPFAMAEDGLLPRVIARSHSRWQTPWVSLALCAAIYSLFALLSFQRLVVVDVIIYCVELLLEAAALIALRVRYPQLHRPFRIAGGWPGLLLLVALLLGCTLILGVAVFLGGAESALQLGIAAAVLISGPVAYFVLRPVTKHTAIPPWFPAT